MKFNRLICSVSIWSSNDGVLIHGNGFEYQPRFHADPFVLPCRVMLHSTWHERFLYIRFQWKFMHTSGQWCLIIEHQYIYFIWCIPGHNAEIMVVCNLNVIWVVSLRHNYMVWVNHRYPATRKPHSMFAPIHGDLLIFVARQHAAQRSRRYALWCAIAWVSAQVLHLQLYG